jgi:hypothetical protein
MEKSKIRRKEKEKLPYQVYKDLGVAVYFEDWETFSERHPDYLQLKPIWEEDVKLEKDLGIIGEFKHCHDLERVKQFWNADYVEEIINRWKKVVNYNEETKDYEGY